LLKAPDVADMKGRRYRRLRTFGDDIGAENGLVGETPNDFAGFARFALDLPCDGDIRRQLISLTPKRERPDFGTRRQRLWRHVGLVRKHARDLVERLAVSGEIRQAVNLAAAWHDQGKDREIWQGAVGHKRGEQPLGKSGGSVQRIPGNYRHEFGSLRQFGDAHEGKIPNDVFDLAMHLIAAHHGRGRPHFPKGGFDPEARAKSPQIAVDVIRRFGRLQHKYGRWRLAYLESLLRCADAAASAEDK
jgi:CRISPR-associated helicase Cas3